jgi:hypothetical protein
MEPDARRDKIMDNNSPNEMLHPETGDSRLSELGDEINSSGKQFFDNVVLDNILEAMVELTAQVWTYRDRSIILERVLQDIVGDGKDIAALIEAYEPTEADNAARAAERAELVSNVFRSFSRRPVSTKTSGGPS